MLTPVTNLKSEYNAVGATLPEPTELFQILVPTIRSNSKPYRTRFHRVWDAKVRAISGGLTILPPVIGQWVDNEDVGTLYKERMIPVQIACTESQFIEILKMSKDYYHQIKMYGFRLSSKVWII